MFHHRKYIKLATLLVNICFQSLVVEFEMLLWFFPFAWFVSLMLLNRVKDLYFDVNTWYTWFNGFWKSISFIKKLPESGTLPAIRWAISEMQKPLYPVRCTSSWVFTKMTLFYDSPLSFGDFESVRKIKCRLFDCGSGITRHVSFWQRFLPRALKKT